MAQARHHVVADTQRRPSPDRATSNIDPKVVSTPPSEWSTEQFLRGIEQLARHRPTAEAEDSPTG